MQVKETRRFKQRTDIQAEAEKFSIRAITFVIRPTEVLWNKIRPLNYKRGQSVRLVVQILYIKSKVGPILSTFCLKLKLQEMNE